MSSRACWPSRTGAPRRGGSSYRTWRSCATASSTGWRRSGQSYVVDKRLKVSDLRFERIDVITGAVLTRVIGVFVVVACAATLHADGRHVDDAADAALALLIPGAPLIATSSSRRP